MQRRTDWKSGATRRKAEEIHQLMEQFAAEGEGRFDRMMMPSHNKTRSTSGYRSFGVSRTRTYLTEWHAAVIKGHMKFRNRKKNCRVKRTSSSVGAICCFGVWWSDDDVLTQQNPFPLSVPFFWGQSDSDLPNLMACSGDKRAHEIQESRTQHGKNYARATRSFCQICTPPSLAVFAHEQEPALDMRFKSHH